LRLILHPTERDPADAVLPSIGLIVPRHQSIRLDAARSYSGMIMLLLSLSRIMDCELLLRASGVRIADAPYLNFGHVDSHFVPRASTQHRQVDPRPKTFYRDNFSAGRRSFEQP
jgi:hypothetical protein